MRRPGGQALTLSFSTCPALQYSAEQEEEGRSATRPRSWAHGDQVAQRGHRSARPEPR